jgi:hypothetical protein
MFLLMVIIILIAATSILSNIYVWIFPFQQNYGDLENYSNSQYAAISAIERWLLVTKHKKPSFIWSGWFIWTWNWWEISDIFSWAFWKYNQWDNGIYRNINSQCNSEKWILKNNQVLVFNTYHYDTTPIYTWDNEISTDSISTIWEVNWTFTMPISSVNLIKWNIYRQIEWDDKIEWYTWFVTSSWNTNIKISDINTQQNIIFNKTTINPTWVSNTWDLLCTQSWCYHANITDLIPSPNNDKWIILYIQDRLTDNNNQIWSIKYNLENNFSWNCQNYTITWISIVWKYKQTISIKKPAFNYKNPNRENFIFPYYK